MSARRNELTRIRGYDGLVLAKNCSVCDELKLLAEFRPEPRNKEDGRTAQCLACHNSETRKRRDRPGICRDCSEPAVEGTRRCEKHRQSDLDRQQKRYAETPEVVRQYERARVSRLRERTPEQVTSDAQRLRPDGRKRCRVGPHFAPLDAFSRNLGEPDGRMPVCIVHNNLRLLKHVWPCWEDSDLWRCIYCDAPFEEVEHVIPRAQGGTDDPNNLVPSCVACNRGPGGKFDRTPAQWRPELADAVIQAVLMVRGY